MFAYKSSYYMERFSHQCDIVQEFSTVILWCLPDEEWELAETADNTTLHWDFWIGITIVAFIVLRLLAFIKPRIDARNAVKCSGERVQKSTI